MTHCDVSVQQASTELSLSGKRNERRHPSPRKRHKMILDPVRFSTDSILFIRMKENNPC